MAGFRMHVGTSTLLGCGYAGALTMHGVPANTAIVSGAMCGVAGMLPDLDSDLGVPLREVMSFAAATIPVLMVNRFESLGMSFDAMALASVALYLFVRFGVAGMIRKFTTHRGMFHSIPAMFICGGLAFLLCGGSQAMYSWVKAGGVMLGYLSHLVLDEIYSIEFASGRWRMKKSFGTSMKLWSDNHWANTAAYSKLALVGMTVLGEPSVMQHVAAYNPQLAAGITSLRSTVQTVAPNGIPTNGADVARAAINFFDGQSQGPNTNPAMNGGWSQNPSAPQPQYPNAGAPQYANSGQQSYNNGQQQSYNNAPQQYYGNGQQANYNNGQTPTGNPPTDWPGPTQLNTPQQSSPNGFNNSFNTAQRAGSNFPQ
jgi:hypothetical protein